MFYKKNNSKELAPELFKNPTAEYRCTPFWAWNCELKEDELLKEIDFMKEMGMGGFHMHTRTGMATEYLSDDYMAFIKACNEKAKAENMISWLYDEDKWPSGFAGGYVTKKKENRQKFLMVTTKPYSKDDVSQEQIDMSARAKRSNNGYLVAKYDVLLDSEGYLKSYRRLAEDEAGENTLWYAYLETQSEGPWFNYQTYVDTLSKSAIDDFISTTHERYKEVLGDEFGESVPAIFTDEPQVTTKTCLSYALDKSDIILPFTTDFDDTYKLAYGESILEKLPEVIWDKKNVVNTTRYRYHDHATERFVEAFCDNVGGWCRKNNIMLTGHVMNEPTLGSQTRSVGEAMRAYRGFDLPGVDMLCDAREFTTVKQTASATHQFGYPGVLSELYGVTNWNFDFRGHKMQGDWQAALGVTVRVPHLYWVSMKGEAKRDYPASIGHQSAWYKEYSFIEDHFARVNTLMTRGKADIKIGVVHPIESYWMMYGPNDQTGEIRNQMDERFSTLTNWLLFGNLDFDFICESNLPALYKQSKTGFTVGEMTYDVVVVPAMNTMRSTTLAALENFAKSGGKVIFMGSAPTMLDAECSDKPGQFAKTVDFIDWDKNKLFTALEPYRTVKIRNDLGRDAENLFYSMRVDGENKNLFICHVNDWFRKKAPQKEIYKIEIAGEFKPFLMDTFTGDITEISAEYKEGKTILEWQCYPHSSLLLKLEPGKTVVAPAGEITEFTEEYLSEVSEVILSEPNVCVLDMAKWRIDEGEWQEKDEMLRVCDKVKKTLGLSTAATNGAQPWCTVYDEPKNKVSIEMTFNSEVEVPNAMVALEDFDISEIRFNGKKIEKQPKGYYVDFSITKVDIGTINKGENSLIITKPFNVVSNLENVFILGDFGVSVKGSKVTLTKQEKTVDFGDWVDQGLAFYGGEVTYRCKIQGGSNAKLGLGLYLAPCVTVALDGEVKGNVSLAPHTVDLGYLSEGEHTLDIKVYASRVNTFGTFHLSDYKETWFGPPAWHTTGDRWAYEYRLEESGLLTAPRLLRY